MSMDNDAQLQALKQHMDDKFENHDKMDALRHQRIDELMDHYSKSIDNNDETIKRIHTRVDRIDTKIKTVQGIGTALATALGVAAAWIGLTGK